MSDRLVQRAQQGDRQAFAALVAEHEDALYRTALSMLEREHDAADALQETVLRAYEHMGDLRRTDAFKTWVTRILVNVCRDYLKEAQRVIPLSAEDVLDLKHERGRRAHRDPADRLALDAALQRLGVKHREALVLYYIQDLPAPEIADILEIPVGTVRSRIHYGLRRLADILRVGRRQTDEM